MNTFSMIDLSCTRPMGPAGIDLSCTGLFSKGQLSRMRRVRRQAGELLAPGIELELELSERYARPLSYQMLRLKCAGEFGEWRLYSTALVWPI